MKQLPVLLLVTQLARQFAKPLSKSIVNYASRRPNFRKYGLIVPGRVYHRIECTINALRMKPKIGTLRKIPKRISDEEAADIGSMVMIEVVVFGILVVLLCLDWIRSSRKADREEQRHKMEMEGLKDKKVEAQKRIEALHEQTAKLEALRKQLEEQLQTEASKPKK